VFRQNTLFIVIVTSVPLSEISCYIVRNAVMTFVFKVTAERLTLRGSRVKISARGPAMLTEVSRGFPQFLKMNAGIVF
jgi:hypothetical protein